MNVFLFFLRCQTYAIVGSILYELYSSMMHTWGITPISLMFMTSVSVYYTLVSAKKTEVVIIPDDVAKAYINYGRICVVVFAMISCLINDSQTVELTSRLRISKWEYYVMVLGFLIFAEFILEIVYTIIKYLKSKM